MIKRKAISLLLLCLTLLVNGHNMFLHTHEEAKDMVSQIDEHFHSHDHHHHHTEAKNNDLFAWARGLFGHFDHQDLGENHFEIFLRSEHSIHPIQISINTCQPSFLPAQISHRFHGLDEDFLKTRPPEGTVSCSNPPCLDSGPSRAPPTFF